MNAIAEHLRSHILANGAVTVAEFFKIAVCGRPDSYYNSRVPMGAEGDFITAPEISQVFGECVGGWCVELWMKLGKPLRFNLIELGPGRGTLMRDVLRVGGVRPGFTSAARAILVEVSPVLKEQQATVLASSEAESIVWLSRFDELKVDAPTIIFANEFIDALPVHQYQRIEGGWGERCVSLDASEAFQFEVRRDIECSHLIPLHLRRSPVGSIVERGLEAEEIARSIGRSLHAAGGAVLIIDYGYFSYGTGDTLQALRRHHYADVLGDIGETDLTFHVNFEALRQSFEVGGLSVGGVLTQAEFLRRLGFHERTEILKRNAHEGHVRHLDRALQRLTASDQMGSLFKVLCAFSPALVSSAGL